MISKNKKIIIIISVVAIIAIVIIRYSFLAVFWLTTPGDGEITANEKVLFEKIKEENHAKKVWREPKYNMTAPKDTTTYRIIVNDIPCDSDTLGLEAKAKEIKNEINKLNLHKNFYKYEIIYACIDGKDYNYSYLR
ncbi:hypothetical protein [Flavobacterium sp. '19STA2R22 D10 B1']|uniref:hypothetical protein n=1 Tax=Flavobacterium aerium TaxID=3037261 RepID=UPI00278C0644|nr:hypothetical protein [Flavobacterium sp. '19STA2R22 D10 B1']